MPASSILGGFTLKPTSTHVAVAARAAVLAAQKAASASNHAAPKPLRAPVGLQPVATAPAAASRQLTSRAAVGQVSVLMRAAAAATVGSDAQSATGSNKPAVAAPDGVASSAEEAAKRRKL